MKPTKKKTPLEQAAERHALPRVKRPRTKVGILVARAICEPHFKAGARWLARTLRCEFKAQNPQSWVPVNSMIDSLMKKVRAGR